MNVPYVFKKCSKCGKWLIANTYNFHKDKQCEYGLKSKCKKCRAEQHKQYSKQNREKILEQKKQYRENNKEKISEYGKQYRATPRGQVLTFNKHCIRRLRKQNQGNGITPEQWLEMMNYFDWKCAYSGITLTKENRSIDHIKPLNQGGEHEVWNVVPMDRGLNSSKSDKDLLEWYQEQDFYSKERLQKIYEWQEYAFNKWHKEEII